MSDKQQKIRKRPALFLALGNADLPKTIVVGGAEYHHLDTYKHDTWAATGIYTNPADQRVICKINRLQSFFGIPMSWIGRILARRESAFLKRLADLELVPSDLGNVAVDGKVIPTAIARSYVAGEPFRTADQIDEEFFAELKRILATLHERNLAYVDLHKRENIIVDTNGRPNLIDFQVSMGLSLDRPGKKPLTRYFLTLFQEMDVYHYRKHYARCLGDSLTAEERRQYLEPPWFIHWHRKLIVPFRQLRRRLLVWLKIRDKSGQAHSELEPEHALRVRPDEMSERDQK